jgi:hypothetical protein
MAFSDDLGLMYKKWVLDCISNLGYAVSVDFSTRPELYKGVSDATADNLTLLQSEYGYNANFPNDATRLMLMKGILGESDGHGSGNDGSIFQSSRMPVLAAAADFAGAEESTLPIHRERTRSAIIPFRTFMEDLEGASFKQTKTRMETIFETAQSILKDEKIAAVFGINKAINANWPLESTDPEGAKLIEQITTQLTNTPYGVITRNKVVRMQRMAQEGQESIVFILKNDIESIAVTDDSLDALIRQLYAWGSNLGLVGAAPPQPTIARVQPPYRAVSRATRIA